MLPNAIPSILQFSLVVVVCHLSLYFQGESEVHIHWKGAAEIVLSSCTSWLDPDGSVKPMDQDKVKAF